MQKILITRFWVGDAYKRLEGKYLVDYNPEQIDGMEQAELLKKMRDADAVISFGDSITAEMMEASPNLKVIADVWHGKGIDKDYAKKRGIKIISHSYGMSWLYNAEVEHLFMLLLAVKRRLREADAFVRAGKFIKMEQANQEMLGYGLKGHTLGIIGGTAWTGKEIVKRANAFEMQTVYWDHGFHSNEMEALGAKALSLEELLKIADGIMLVVQREDNGGYLLDKEQFSLMKHEAVIVNVTHGHYINERELAKAISEGRIYGAGLDKLEKTFTPAQELLSLPSVILTPHSDGAIYSARASLFEDLVSGVEETLRQIGN